MNNDERMARDVGEWAGEDVRSGVEYFRSSGFESRLRQRLAAAEAGPSRRPWLPIAASVAVLAVVAGAVIYLRRPSFQRTSGRESIRAFFAEYSTLRRLQASSDTMAGPGQTLQLPGLEMGRPSRRELSELFQSSLPSRDLGIREFETPGESHAAPRELKQAIDRFFSTTLKSIKEKT